MGGLARVAPCAHTPRPHLTCHTAPSCSHHRRGPCWSPPSPRHMPEPCLSCHRAQGVALPVSLPAPHPALTARAAQPQVVIDEVLAGARWVLATCPNLAIVILVPKASVGGPARVTLRATPRPHHTCRTTPSRHRRGACWSTPGPRHMPELRHSYPPIQGKHPHIASMPCNFRGCPKYDVDVLPCSQCGCSYINQGYGGRRIIIEHLILPLTCIASLLPSYPVTCKSVTRDSTPVSTTELQATLPTTLTPMIQEYEPGSWLLVWTPFQPRLS
ncbi:hypothetical protein BJV78DRAFT_833778 [Lactifluus subvellereus]|nr:hypothetical protein BJV78DRAFT_833778 [Lactifluus subvellereus]